MKCLVPCADQEAAGCADLLMTQGLEVAESEGDQQVDARPAACQEASLLVAFQEEAEHVQRGALDVSLEAD